MQYIPPHNFTYADGGRSESYGVTRLQWHQLDQRHRDTLSHRDESTGELEISTVAFNSLTWFTALRLISLAFRRRDWAPRVIVPVKLRPLLLTGSQPARSTPGWFAETMKAPSRLFLSVQWWWWRRNEKELDLDWPLVNLICCCFFLFSQPQPCSFMQSPNSYARLCHLARLDLHLGFSSLSSPPPPPPPLLPLSLWSATASTHPKWELPFRSVGFCLKTYMQILIVVAESFERCSWIKWDAP